MPSQKPRKPAQGASDKATHERLEAHAARILAEAQEASQLLLSMRDEEGRFQDREAFQAAQYFGAISNRAARLLGMIKSGWRP